MKLLRFLSVACVVAMSPLAGAAPCAGFSDVDSASSLCPNVEWLKNRAITLGCGVGIYCPAGSVTRLQMAAFMNRLGTALTPQELKAEQGGAIDLDASIVVCQTTSFTATGYPRRVFLDVAFSGRASVAVDISADLVATLDNGANWSALGAVGSRGTMPANEWGSMANIASTDLAVGDSARFGVRVGRASGTVDLSDSRCTLRALVVNRNPTSPPL